MSKRPWEDFLYINAPSIYLASSKEIESLPDILAEPSTLRCVVSIFS